MAARARRGISARHLRRCKSFRTIPSSRMISNPMNLPGSLRNTIEGCTGHREPAFSVVGFYRTAEFAAAKQDSSPGAEIVMVGGARRVV